MVAPSTASEPAELERRAQRRFHERHASAASAADPLSPLSREELLERLTLVSLQPARILDVGAGDGEAARELARRFPKAQVIALDHASGRCARARRRRGWRHRYQVVQGDLRALPFADESFDLVFANLVLQDCVPPDQALLECRRVLRAGNGLLTFATLGPATLSELREAWTVVDDRCQAHVHDFVDMHDLGEALGRCGLREPVLDVDRLGLTYSSLDALLRELRVAGGGCTLADRRRTLTGAGRLRALREECARRVDGDGRLRVTAELVFGHAWASAGPPPEGRSGGARNAAGAVTISPADIGRR